MPRLRSLLAPSLALGGLLGLGCTDLPERLIAENDRVALKAGLEAAEAAGRIKPLDARSVPDTAALVAILQRSLTAAELPPMTLTLGATYAIEDPDAPEAEDAPPADAPPEDAPADDAPPAADAPDAADAPPPAPLPPPRIEETRTLRLGPAGAFAYDQLTTAGGGDLPLAEDGRRCIWVDGDFYTGHRHGPYTAFDAVADEHHRCLDGALEPLATVVRLFADRLEVAVEGPAVVLGRDVLPVTLRAIAGGKPPPPLDMTYGEDGLDEGQSPAIFGLRAPLVVGYTHLEHFDARLLLDADSGQPLGGRISARLPFSKAGRRATLTLELTLEASPFEGAIEAPTDPRRYGPRQRIFDDRRRLLGEAKAPAAGVPALPAPGDAPRLGIDEDGQLRTEGAGQPDAPAAPDEDRPPPAERPIPIPPPTGGVQDEDRPE